MQFRLYVVRRKVCCRDYLPVKLFDLFVQFDMYKVQLWLLPQLRQLRILSVKRDLHGDKHLYV